jgi:intracellular septation protein
MKLLYDFFPIIVFFIIFKLFGIYAATASAIVISLAQVIVHWVRFRKFDMMQVITLIIIVIFGGATLVLHDVMFIKWKVSVINWAFALVFLGSQWIGDKNIMQRMLAGKIELPQQIWVRLNMLWVGYFLVLGFINIYVVYHFSTEAWVNFKLFGVLGLTVVFVIIQSIYLSKHLKDEH